MQNLQKMMICIKFLRQSIIMYKWKTAKLTKRVSFSDWSEPSKTNPTAVKKQLNSDSTLFVATYSSWKKTLIRTKKFQKLLKQVKKTEMEMKS
jgi:hypothetical protein